MRHVKGANDPAVAAGNAIALIIDIGATYPDKPTANTQVLATVTSLGVFPDGSDAVYFTTSINPAATLTANPPATTSTAAAVPSGEVVEGAYSPEAFVAAYGIATP